MWLSASFGRRRVVCSLVLAITILALAPSVGNAWRSGKPIRYGHLSATGGLYYNYDGNAHKDRNGRDWPIGMIFYRNASYEKVRNIFDGDGFTRKGGTQWLGYKSNPGAERRFDGDKGRKTACDAHGADDHYRQYSPSNADRFYDPDYGFFVVASAHEDHDDGGGDCSQAKRKFFGFSEDVEERLHDLASAHGYAVKERYIGLGNKEVFRAEARRGSRAPEHYWLNDGKATMIRVP